MTAADGAIAYAKSQIGKPYAWAKEGPDSFDCSGLTFAAYRSVGIRLGRTTYEQVTNGVPVSKTQLMPGDLVFPHPGHVQLYLGNGQVIHAPTFGDHVRIATLGTVWSARRVTEPGSVSTGSGVKLEPVGIVDGALGGLGSLSQAASWASNSRNWLRVGWFLAGAIFIAMAIWKLSPAGEIVKGAREVVTA